MTIYSACSPRLKISLAVALTCTLLACSAAPLREAMAAQGSSITTATRISTVSTQAISSTPTPDPCRDQFEDDGVPAQAKLLVTGEEQTHVFCPAGDADWLKFFANSGKGYSLETSKLAVGVDTYLNLFAPDGQTLLSTNDDKPRQQGDNAQPGTSQIIFYPQSDGWYYLQAKNQGDIGSAGLQYTVSLRQVNVPTSTPTATPSTTASSTPATAPTAPTASLFVADLLHPQKEDGGLDVFTAGSRDVMQPDAFEPNDSKEGARPINVGAVYRYLNFVPASVEVGAGALNSMGAVDADFFSFRAKPGLCYLVQTSDLSAGLDTTILLWRPAITTDHLKSTDKWKLVAQNDDARPGSPDLGSAVRWCTPVDTSAVIEIRNYGGAVATDPRGKSYSLTLRIDPPTPVPTRVPPASVPAVPPEVAPQRVVQSAGSSSATVSQVSPPTAVVRQPPTATQVPPTSTPTTEATPTMAPSATPVPPTPTLAPPSPTSTPQPNVRVDVVAYVGDQTSTGPNPGDGIVDLPVLLVDVRTNAVMQRALTDQNGHAGLSWQWQGPVRVAMPAFRWGKTLQMGDFKPSDSADGGGVAVGSGGGGSLMLQARMSSYLLPGILP